MGAAIIAAATVLLLSAGRVAGQFDYASLTNPNALQTGEATFYGAGQDNQGTCSFSSNFANTNDLPWTTGCALTLALNDNQFADSAACGLCVMYRGNGAGLGTTPVPSTWTMGFVNNRCPECSKGDLDQATSGDGRWNVEWYAVPCNVGSSALVYSIVVSSYYWFSLVVSNTRTPITGVSINIGGNWLPLKRTNNNQWAYYNTNGPWQSSFPMPIRVTNVLGETVTDSITSATGNSGTVQFSASGSGSTSATPTGNTTISTAGPPTTQTAAAGATPPSIPATPPKAATPPAAVATPPTAAAVAATPPAAAVAATPPAVASATPPASTTPPAPLGTGGFYIENNQQCGGNGGSCNNNAYTAAPCADAAWATATCRSPGYACTRSDASMWVCVPGTAATPPVAATTTPPPAVATTPPPSTVATSPPPSTAATPPPAAANSPPSAGTSNTNLQASQSLAGSSPPVAASQPPPVASSQTPPSAQSPPAAASQPPPVAAAQPPPSNSGGHSFYIQAGGQCGGTSQCSPAGQETDKVTCNNGPWAGAVCSDGTTCQADPGPLIWSCKSSAVATGGRRLLSQ